MNRQAFEDLLAQSGLNQEEFAQQVGFTENEILEWKDSGKIPEWVEGWLKGYICQREMAVIKTAHNILAAKE